MFAFRLPSDTRKLCPRDRPPQGVRLPYGKPFFVAQSPGRVWVDFLRAHFERQAEAQVTQMTAFRKCAGAKKRKSFMCRNILRPCYRRPERGEWDAA